MPWGRCLWDFCTIKTLFCFQHSSILGSVFGDSYYDQQMTARQANALSHQVSKFISDFQPYFGHFQLKINIDQLLIILSM